MKKTLLFTIAPACLLISACGTGSGTPKASADPDIARAKFEKCMRDAGIQIAMGSGDGNVSVRVPRRIGPAKMEQIQKNCTKSSGMPEPKPPSPAMQQAAQDGALKFAACMRAHGVNMPDPKFDGGRITMMIQSKVNRNMPRVKAAQETCQKLMPKLAGGPVGTTSQGGPGGGSGAQFSAP